MVGYTEVGPDGDVVLVYGNCQTPFVTKLLEAADSHQSGRQYVHVLNHAPPGTDVALPDQALFDRCTLYLEQFDDRGEVPLRDSFRARLDPSVPRVVFPPIVMQCFWPFDALDARIRTTPHYPWGRYNGDKIGLKIAQQGLRGDEAYDAYMKLSAEKMPDLTNRLSWDINKITARDAGSDVKIGDYLHMMYRHKHLFWTPGHLVMEPVAILACRLYEGLASFLGGDIAQGLDRIDAKAEAIGVMCATQYPIHPLVAERLGLEFGGPDTVYQWFDQFWTFRDYITRYIANDESWGFQE